MSTVLPDLPPTEWTIATVQARLPGFPAERIRVYPIPGTATEQDVLDAEARSNRICELIDGTLVEKVMATKESMLALVLAQHLLNYLDANDIGMLAGEAGLLRILPGQIRPDVSFIRWERLPDREAPKPPIYAVVPDLAVEILSEGNTEAEMDRKLRDYFRAGVKLVWRIDPRTRTARSYTAYAAWTEIGPSGALAGRRHPARFRIAVGTTVRPGRRAAGPVSPQSGLSLQLGKLYCSRARMRCFCAVIEARAQARKQSCRPRLRVGLGLFLPASSIYCSRARIETFLARLQKPVERVLAAAHGHGEQVPDGRHFHAWPGCCPARPSRA